MECKNHMGRPAVNTCSKCGDWLCEDCSVEINGRIYCKSCLSKQLSDDYSSMSAPIPPTPSMSMGGYEHVESRPVRRKPISGFFTFCCSLMPGCGQMYLGLMKRGFSLMALFFGLIYLTAELSWVFNFAVISLWFFSFFDTFSCKNKILNGEYITDDIDDIKSFLKKNKTAILVALVVIFLSGILSYIRSFMYYGFGGHSFQALVIGAVLICLGLAFIFDNRKKSDR